MTRLAVCSDVKCTSERLRAGTTVGWSELAQLVARASNVDSSKLSNGDAFRGMFDNLKAELREIVKHQCSRTPTVSWIKAFETGYGDLDGACRAGDAALCAQIFAPKNPSQLAADMQFVSVAWPGRATVLRVLKAVQGTADAWASPEDAVLLSEAITGLEYMIGREAELRKLIVQAVLLDKLLGPTQAPTTLVDALDFLQDRFEPVSLTAEALGDGLYAAYKAAAKPKASATPKASGAPGAKAAPLAPPVAEAPPKRRLHCLRSEE